MVTLQTFHRDALAHNHRHRVWRFQYPCIHRHHSGSYTDSSGDIQPSANAYSRRFCHCQTAYGLTTPSDAHNLPYIYRISFFSDLTPDHLADRTHCYASYSCGRG